MTESAEGATHANRPVDIDNRKPADIPYPTPNNLLGRPPFVDVLRKTDAALPYAPPQLRSFLAELAYEGPVEPFYDEETHEQTERTLAAYYGSNKKPAEVLNECYPVLAKTLTSELREEDDIEEIADETIQNQVKDYLEHVFGERSRNLSYRLGDNFVSKAPLKRSSEAEIVERLPDKIGRWRSLEDFPITLNGFTLTEENGFWNHPSIASSWDREINQAVQAIGDHKPIMLIGPHGTGKSEQFSKNLALQMESRGIPFGMDITRHDMRNYGSSWETVLRLVEDPDDKDRLSSLLKQQMQSLEDITEDNPGFLIIDEAPATEPENILKVTEALGKRFIKPIFLVPNGYSQIREQTAEWAQENGFVPVLAEHKKIPKELAVELFKAGGADPEFIQFLDEPEGKTLLHLRLFSNLIERILPSPHVPVDLIKNLDDLGAFLTSYDADPKTKIPKKVYGASGRDYNQSILEGMILEKSATAAEVFALADRLGIRDSIRREVVADIHKGSPTRYDLSLDPLAYD